MMMNKGNKAKRKMQLIIVKTNLNVSKSNVKVVQISQRMTATPNIFDSYKPEVG